MRNKIKANKIPPANLEGKKINITTRNYRIQNAFYFEDCQKQFFTYKTYDNTSAIILEVLDEQFCMSEDETLYKNKDDRISGQEIYIYSEKILKHVLINESGRHKAQSISTVKHTICKLIKPEDCILKDNAYNDFVVTKQTKMNNGDFDKYDDIKIT